MQNKVLQIIIGSLGGISFIYVLLFHKVLKIMDSMTYTVHYTAVYEYIALPVFIFSITAVVMQFILNTCIIKKQAQQLKRHLQISCMLVFIVYTLLIIGQIFFKLFISVFILPVVLSQKWIFSILAIMFVYSFQECKE